VRPSRIPDFVQEVFEAASPSGRLLSQTLRAESGEPIREQVRRNQFVDGGTGEGALAMVDIPGPGGGMTEEARALRIPSEQDHRERPPTAGGRGKRGGALGERDVQDDAVVSLVLMVPVAGPVGGLAVDLHGSRIEDSADANARIQEIGSAVVVGDSG
jgi:hypothetical protein